MTLYEQAISRARRALLAVEDRAARNIAAAYAPIAVRLGRRSAALALHVADARDAGVNVTPAWLTRQELYRQLIHGLRLDVAEFAGAATLIVEQAQRDAALQAGPDAETLAVHALGPGPSGGEGAIRALFAPIPFTFIDQLVGMSISGTPVGLLLLELAPDVVHAVSEELWAAAKAGQLPSAVTAAVKQHADMPATRASTIARTEIMSAYHQATDVAYRSSDVVTGWQWYAALNERTCVVCLAMHGTRHPLTDPLASHPACRCTKVPITASWAQLGFPGVPDHRERIGTGEEAFARMTRPEKLAIVGPGRLRLLDDGAVTFADLVRLTDSPRWGPGRREATLTELRDTG